jgi:hypothetical protein
MYSLLLTAFAATRMFTEPLLSNDDIPLLLRVTWQRFSKIRYIIIIIIIIESRNSAVGITTGYGLDDREVGVRVPVR